MSGPTQLFILASYAIIAAAVAVVLPQAAPELGAVTSGLIGFDLFLFAALVHEVLARRAREALAHEVQNRMDAHYQEEVASLKSVNDALLADLAKARQDMSNLSDVVESAAEEANQALLDEMRTFRAQLGQIADGIDEEETQQAVKNSFANLGLTAEEESAPAPIVPPPAYRDDELLAIIQEALEENRVDLYMQPIVSLPQRKTRFYEAFSRIRTPDGTILMPDDYMAIAEQKKLVAVIDNLLLFRCIQLVRRIQRRNMDFGFFVNISTHTLNNARFLAQFIDFMSENRKLAGSMMFEFTQADFARHTTAVEAQLKRLAALGFRFAIDRVEQLELDFADLAGRNARFVKIPARLLLAAGTSDAAPDPRLLKEAADNENIDLICEQLESEKQVVEILDHRFDYGQGYLFGPPRPVREDV